MERKEWLTIVYREANVFLNSYSGEAGPGKLTETELDDLEPELHVQLQGCLKEVDSFEDVIKHSLLKDPPPDLWYGENSWQGVLIGVASTCLLHDVKGIILKIISGELPKADPTQFYG